MGKNGGKNRALLLDLTRRHICKKKFRLEIFVLDGQIIHWAMGANIHGSKKREDHAGHKKSNMLRTMGISPR